MKKKYFIKTFGCQMNTRDSELIAGMMHSQGYVPCKIAYDADIIIYNTCSVREHAEDRVWGQVGALAKLKEKKMDLIIGIVGCMAKAQGDTILKRLPHVDFISGPANIFEIPKILEQIQEKRKTYDSTNLDQRPYYAHQPAVRQRSFSAYVSIMEGCNNFCTYCVVPYVRGREISRKPEDIINEVKNLIDNGYKDITLLGQNVNSYGVGIDQECDFIQLLEKIDSIAKKIRIRFIASHPKDASGRLFHAMRDLPSLCEYLHLPFQAGSDRILGLMNRRYTIQDYIYLMEQFGDICPQASKSTDVIVGFPTETEDDFYKTKQVIAQFEFDMSYFFKYSPRPYTEASQMKDDVPQEVKQRRLQELLSLQDDVLEQKHAKLIGQRVEVLAEDVAIIKPNIISADIQKNYKYCFKGRTRDNKNVIFLSNQSCLGELVNVAIEYSSAHSLIGKVQNKE